MPLPPLIEIVPLVKPVRAEITVPGSKSITNRALILAALADGQTKLEGALWSEDTQVMVDCLRELGFNVEVAPDPDEASNRVITVSGKGGFVPPGGSDEQPVELFIGNAGTAARFLVPLVCLGKGAYWVHGVARMHQRPQSALFKALRSLGYRIDSENDKLPALVHGGGPRAGKCRVSIDQSSQFASALLLAGNGHGWEVEVVGANREEQPYVDMTRELIKSFPAHGEVFHIEPDASSGSYFLGAGWLLHNYHARSTFEVAASRPTWPLVGQDAESAEPVSVSVSYWPNSGWQIDAEFLNIISARVPHFVCRQGGPALAEYRRFVPLPEEVSREQHLGDSIMTVAVLAPLMERSVRLTDLGRLRVQETERVAALRAELSRCGAEVVEEGDTLTILPSGQKLHGAEIETYNDHRMAMCFSILGLKVPGIKIKNPSCVKKTFPDFFQKLAAPPPVGLGAIIRDVASGRNLSGEELFAE
jgi:3-phosphoshikimate 1-carboxyvinyltransferase